MDEWVCMGSTLGFFFLFFFFVEFPVQSCIAYVVQQRAAKLYLLSTRRLRCLLFNWTEPTSPAAALLREAAGSDAWTWRPPDPSCCRCRHHHAPIISFFTQSFNDFIILLQHAPPLAWQPPLQRNVFFCFFFIWIPASITPPPRLVFDLLFYEKNSHQIKIR